jgi:hypothetical protein
MAWMIQNSHFQGNISGALDLIVSLADDLLVRVRTAISTTFPMKANSIGDGLGSIGSLLNSHSDQRRGNRYGVAQGEVNTTFGTTPRVDEEDKSKSLERDGKIANSDMFEADVQAMAKRFGAGRVFHLGKLGR